MERKPSKRYRFRFTLAPRLMLAFAVFGMAIGYLTFLFTSFINPLVMFQKASKYIFETVEIREDRSLGETIEDMLKEPSTQKTFYSAPKLIVFASMVLRNKQKAKKLRYIGFTHKLWGTKKTFQDILRPLPEQQNHLISVVFYSIDPSSGSWQALDVTAPSDTETFVPSMDISEALDSLLKKEGELVTRPFIRKRDEVSLLVNITDDTDIRRYALGFTFKRLLLSGYLRENKTQFIVFTVFVGLFSLILAKIFSNRISRPIIRLTKKAAVIAQGDLSQRFKILRRDEIGSLANSLNIMADEIEKRMVTIQLSTGERCGSSFLSVKIS